MGLLQKEYSIVSQDAEMAVSEERPSTTSHFSWRDVALLILFISTVGLAIPYFRRQPSPEHSYIGNNHRIWLPYNWTTIYSSFLPSDTTDAWSSIVPAHGIVALDHKWAASNNLPQSINLPDDKSKGVYIIDAYHQIHCLTIIRTTLRALLSGLPPPKESAHSFHCFDSLRQYIMCTAGDTPLYTFGGNRTGDGQARLCRSWKQLSDWAKEHTACYADGDRPVRLIEHFRRCAEGEGEGEGGEGGMG